MSAPPNASLQTTKFNERKIAKQAALLQCAVRNGNKSNS